MGAFVSGLSIAACEVAQGIADHLKPLREFFLILFFWVFVCVLILLFVLRLLGLVLRFLSNIGIFFLFIALFFAFDFVVLLS